MRLAVLAVASLCMCTVAAHAESIVLESVSNGTYTYGLLNSGGEIFRSGNQITIAGLYGVTAASAGYSQFSTVFTSTEVTFTENGNNSAVTFGGPTEFNNFFTITSTAGVSGLASYSSDGSPAFAGTVTGPVAATVTPEPSSIVLLGTGLLSFAGVVRKRFA